MSAALKVLASGAVNPSYVVSFGGGPTGGTFTVTITRGVNGSSPNAQTATITYTTGLTPAAVQTAVQALTGMSDVTVAGSNGGAFTFTIPNGAGPATLTASGASLTGGSSPSTVVTTVGAEATVYTVPASVSVKVSTASLTLATSIAAVTSASVIPSGGSQDGSHRVLSALAQTGSDTISQEDYLAALKGAMLDTGVAVSVSCSQPATYLLTGAVIS